MFRFKIEEMPIISEGGSFRFEIGVASDGSAVWFQGLDRPRVRRVFCTYGEGEDVVEEDIEIEVVNDVFATAAEEVFGEEWGAILESLLDLKDAGTWRRNNRVPPPMIFAWIGYLASSPRPRATGVALLARSLNPSCEDITRAFLAWDARPA